MYGEPVIRKQSAYPRHTLGVSENVTSEKIRVRYAETDQMGHAYYANYLVWMEQARSAFFRERGLPYKQVEELGFKLPVVEVGCRYKNEIKYDDLVEVRTRLGEIKRAAIKVEYEIFNAETGVLCATGFTWHVLVGPEFKAVSIPPFLREILEASPVVDKA